MRVIDCIEIYSVLKELKDLKEVASADRIAIVKCIHALKPIVEDYKSFDFELQEHLKPTGYDELLQVIIDNQKAVLEGKEPTASKEQLTLFALLDKQFAAAYLKPRREKETEGINIELAHISMDGFDKICQSNNLDAERCAILYNIV